MTIKIIHNSKIFIPIQKIKAKFGLINKEKSESSVLLLSFT